MVLYLTRPLNLHCNLKQGYNAGMAPMADRDSMMLLVGGTETSGDRQLYLRQIFL
jgi:hypothetical protein